MRVWDSLRGTWQGAAEGALRFSGKSGPSRQRMLSKQACWSIQPAAVGTLKGVHREPAGLHEGRWSH